MEDNTIMSEIMTEANRHDIHNMQFEQDILFSIKKMEDMLQSKVMASITSVESQLKVVALSSRITSIFDTFTNTCKILLRDKFKEYSRYGYDNMDKLIQSGKEMEGKLIKYKLKEQKSITEYDGSMVDFIRDHAFELLTNYEESKVSQMKIQLNTLLLTGKFNKANVRSVIEKIMNTSSSKAEEIAQTELSRAYNYGMTSRMKEYSTITNTKTRKYWHGFKYSEVTCEYCRDRIGGIYDIDDDSEILPAHPRCRCVWLPILNGWDSPVSGDIVSRANMLNTTYSADMIYQRINNKLDITYGRYIDINVATKYLSGDRSQLIMSAIAKARQDAIDDVKSSFNIVKEVANMHMANEFNSQIKFWKELISKSIVDNDKDTLYKSIDAIKGVMLLPWSAQQLVKWNDLISEINNRL